MSVLSCSLRLLAQDGVGARSFVSGQKAAGQIQESEILQGLLNTWMSPEAGEVLEPRNGIALGQTRCMPALSPSLDICSSHWVRAGGGWLPRTAGFCSCSLLRCFDIPPE